MTTQYFGSVEAGATEIIANNKGSKFVIAAGDNIAVSANTATATVTVSVNGVMGDELAITQDNSTNATNYVIFNNASSGNLAPRTDTDFYYNPATGVLSVTAISSTRINPRVISIASGATITPSGDTADQYNITALAVDATIDIPSGTATAGQRLTIRIKDDGTARALTWTTSGTNSYRIVGTTLPTTTVVSKVLYIGCIYNATDSFWDVVAVAQQA